MTYDYEFYDRLNRQREEARRERELKEELRRERNREIFRLQDARSHTQDNQVKEMITARILSLS